MIKPLIGVGILDHIAAHLPIMKKMATADEIRQELNDAKTELKDAKAVLKGFEEGRYGQRLVALEDGLWDKKFWFYFSLILCPFGLILVAFINIRPWDIHI